MQILKLSEPKTQKQPTQKKKSQKRQSLLAHVHQKMNKNSKSQYQTANPKQLKIKELPV